MLLSVISAFCLIAWLVIAARRFAWFCAPPRLGPTLPLARWPGVVAVIPARDEAETIGAVVSAHRASAYAGAFSIIVVDDHSTDATARIATTAGARAMEAPPLPAGWTGKLWAVNNGLAEAAMTAADAKYALLTDADIVLAPETLSRLVAAAERSDAALVSLMARLDARGVWGGLLIPAFVYFFYKLYPFHLVNDPRSKVAAAAGGCMLVRRDALEAIGGVSAIRSQLIDDCALAAAIKRAGFPIWLGMAKDEAISLRDNRSLRSIWMMVSRSAFTQLGHSWVMLAGAVIAMTFLYLAAPVIALSFPIHGGDVSATIAAAAWALMALTYLPIARLYDQDAWKTFALPVAAFFYTLMTISSAIDHARGKGGAWKGRIYTARSGAPSAPSQSSKD